MSEAPRDAASLVLVAEDGRIFWAKRKRRAVFGGYRAFPGGALEPQDLVPEVTALRETFEETGVLAIPGAERVSEIDLAHLRVALLAGELGFADVLDRLGLEPDTSLLVPAGRWLTPPFSPLRFDTRFYLARAPRGQEPVLIEANELEQGEWIAPRAALERWRRDEAILAAPTKALLEVLAATAPLPRDRTALEVTGARGRALSPAPGGWARRIELLPGIFVFPVRTPTLPPATHTNVVLMGDGCDLVAIDPASPYPEERASLDALLDELAAEGQKLRAILLTHRHHDHVSGAEHLAARTGAPILAHAEVRDALRGTVDVTGTLEDGEVIELSPCRAGAVARRVRAVLTPGHANGHLAFLEETSGTVMAGDLVAGFGWIIIDPPEGDMAVYLRSLARLRELGARLLIPSHGPTIGDPAAKADEYVEHRLAREAKVLAAVRAGARALEDVVALAYTDTPVALHPLAARSALAHLLKLEAESLIAAASWES